jgi:hypothetical protein
MRNKPYILSLEKQTLSEALDGKSSTVLIAIADMSTITEFCPVSDKLPHGLSMITLKKGTIIPVKGMPDDIKKLIDQTLES